MMEKAFRGNLSRKAFFVRNLWTIVFYWLTNYVFYITIIKKYQKGAHHEKHHRTIRIIYFTVLILGSFLVGVMISAFNLEEPSDRLYTGDGSPLF